MRNQTRAYMHIRKAVRSAFCIVNRAIIILLIPYIPGECYYGARLDFEREVKKITSQKEKE